MAGANFKSFLNKYREKTGSDAISESRYGEPSYWISTGSMALNRICSGSIKKGIPAGRITILAGENSVGKSLIAATLIANAQKDGCQHVFYFDSEGGAGRQFFENAGCDPESIEQVLVENVEDAQIKILDTFNMIMEYKEKDPDAKFLCVLDSLGALVPSKLFRDAEKDKVTSEMGGRSKIVNNMVKAITIPCLKSGTPMIIINHVYDNPGEMFVSKIKAQGGGKGIGYMGSVNIQCSRCLEKDEDKDSESFYGQSRLHFFTIKNRMIRPSLECDIWLDFKKGFVRQWESLFDEAVRGGFFINTKQGWYSCPTWEDPEKNFRTSYLQSNQATPVWKTFLEKFEEWSNTDLAYKALNQEIDEDELDEVVENNENDNIDEIKSEE
jgi:recombination protein RecA